MRSQPLRSGIRPVSRAAVILSAVGVLGGTAGRDGRPSKLPPAPRPECPMDTIAVTYMDSGNVPHPISRIPVSGPVTNIPEYHDCQRFIIGARYDSLYAIFAAFRLESLPQKLRAADSAAEREDEHKEEHEDEHDADRARNRSAGKAASAASAAQRYGTVPVGTIYSYGGRYAPLGIEPGFNCLFVFKRGGRWRARMVPWGPTDPDCSDAHISPVSGRGFPLEVRHTRKPGMSDQDYPPVARWERGRVEYYIGIACGGEWCQIGHAKFVPFPSYSGPTLAFDPVPGVTVTVPPRRVYTIQGWYDDQRVAIQGANWQEPSGPYGTFVPSPALDQLVHVTDFMKGWVHAASAVVDRDYKKMFKRGVNKVYLCHGPALQSAPNAPACGVQPDVANASCVSDMDGFPWWARIVPARGGAPKDWCVTRRDHTGELAQYIASHPGDIIAIPGAARWRWTSTDDGEWIRCGTGCCTIIPK